MLTIFLVNIQSVSQVLATDGGLPEHAAHPQSFKQKIYKEFSSTHLRSRIVKVKIRKRKKGTKVYLTWHPHKIKDVAKDTFVIVKIIDKIIPDFHSISLRAIEPKSLRWTNRVFWDAVITRKDLHLIKGEVNTGSDDPRPLFY